MRSQFALSGWNMLRACMDREVLLVERNIFLCTPRCLCGPGSSSVPAGAFACGRPVLPRAAGQHAGVTRQCGTWRAAQPALASSGRGTSCPGWACLGACLYKGRPLLHLCSLSHRPAQRCAVQPATPLWSACRRCGWS